MIRATPPIPTQTVMKRMRYIPERIADWSKRFSTKQPDTAEPQKPKRKAPVKKTAAAKRPPATLPKPIKTAQSKPVSKPVAKPKPDALVFFKKQPVTFQVNRLANPADFERMAFVIKACSNDPQHKSLMVLHVEQIQNGSWLVATDNMRLHAAFTPAKIKSGDYKPVITKDTISLGEPVTGIMFPNWRRGIPADTVQRGMLDLADTSWGKNWNHTEKLTKVFNTFIKQTGELVNLRFIEDLAKKRWSVHCQREKNRAVMLKAEGVKPEMFALIMPLKGEAAATAA